MKKIVQPEGTASKRGRFRPVAPHFEDLREEYGGSALTAADVAADPTVQIEAWLSEAASAGEPLANAMTLATADAQGRPSARIVLLKGIDPRGVTFFTNYRSKKGKDLAENPACAAVLYWPSLHRQLRLEGRAERISAAESDAYFASRPPASNASAIASPQSEVIADRAELEARRRTLLDNDDLARPENWGGFRIVLEAVELWQGRPDRLHDRLRYRKTDGDWIIERLAP